MTRPDELKQQVHRFYEEIWNRLDLDAIPDLAAPDLTFRGSLGTVAKGHGELADYVRSVTGSLADYRCEIEDLIAENQHVVARMIFTGVHRAPLLGVPPTGRRVSWAGAAFFTFEGHLIVDIWVLGDLHALQNQLRSTS